MASRVLDKFLFVIFGLITLFFNGIILTQSPYSVDVVYCSPAEEALGNCKARAEEGGGGH